MDIWNKSLKVMGADIYSNIGRFLLREASGGGHQLSPDAQYRLEIADYGCG
jgi:hypothetical protein